MGGSLESIYLFVYLFFFLTSSGIVDAVNATGLCCVRVYVVATLMVNRGVGKFVSFNLQLVLTISDTNIIHSCLRFQI